MQEFSTELRVDGLVERMAQRLFAPGGGEVPMSAAVAPPAESVSDRGGRRHA
jgi:hypothetical protein